MNEIIVYHGGTEQIEKPICKFGRTNLDFGQGFYVTYLREQAVSWATQLSIKRKKTPILNRYRLNREAILKEAKCRIFESYDIEWLNFIVKNRQGAKLTEHYDFVEGGIANDRVVDTINLYMTGLIDIATTLQRLSEHQPNNQICLLNQEIINKYLIYDGTETI